MFSTILWPAPAKLNLMLRIVGRRPDGYHELQTVFQFLSYCDYLDFKLRDDSRVLRANNVAGVPEDADLAVRAARLLQSTAAPHGGVEIRIEKRIPMGGGLGGGSSDAATTLVALNALWDLGLHVDELCELGLRLGADVPVFVNGLASWAEGVGERLQPVDLEEPWYLIITPDCAVPTAAVFADPELTRDSLPITIADFLSGGGGNDCLDVVCKRFPEVSAVLDWLDKRAPARLTGTGSSVFAAFQDEEAAKVVLGQLPTGWRGFVTRGCNRSPLLYFLESRQSA